MNGQENNPGEGLADLPVASANAGAYRQRKLRLCYISNPNSIHTRRWIDWFVKRGHTVCLLADVPPKEPWQGVHLIDLSKIFYAPVLRFAVWSVWLKRFLHQWQPDVLHAHRVNSAGWLAAASGFHPYVVTPWGSDVLIGTQRSRIARLLASFTLTHADRITSISQAISERLIELHALRENIVRVYYGIDMHVFSPGVSDRALSNVLRRDLSLPDEARVVFSPRAIHPIYNQDILLRAIPQVLQHQRAACFVFISYNTAPEYKKKLDDLARDLGVEASIRWLPPTSSPAEMAERYRLADVVISIPSSDGAPVTVMEAMACGKPVICSDLPTLHEFITHGENGWLVPVRNVKLLAEAIARVLAAPDEAAGLGRRALRVVADRADIEVNMQRMEDIYYQLAGARKG